MQMNGKFVMVRADLDQGISEVQNALDTLRDHQGASFVHQSAAPEAHLSSGGAGSSTVGMLEVIESARSPNSSALVRKCA